MIEIHQVWDEGFANGRPSQRIFLGDGEGLDLDDRYPTPAQADAFLDGVKWALGEYLGQEVTTVHLDLAPASGWEEAPLEQRHEAAA